MSLNRTEHVRTSVYMSLCSVCKCMNLYISICICVYLYVNLCAPSDGAYVIMETPITPSCLLMPLLQEWAWPLFNLSKNSSLGYSQTSSWHCHPALTFLRAENPREIPADESLEMLKTAKLGSVTGNLLGLVLADISDSSLSTRQGLT